MKKFFLTNLLLALLCCNVYSSDKGSIYTYFVTTPNGQDETLFLNYDRNVEVDGKNYQQYVGSYLDRSYADPVLLRREEKKYFYYDSRTSEEHLLFDFDLQKGDAFTDDFSGTVYDVVDVRDSLINDSLHRLIEIRDCEGTGKHDIWLEDVGSIYTGILPKNKFKDVYLLICFHFDYSIEEDVEHSTYFFPNTPQIKTAGMSVTRSQWDKELETEEDRDAYLTWLHAPTDLNAEFENDTLHIWGTLRTSCSIQTYAACELSGDNITFKVYPYNNLLDEDCISRYEVETRIPGFKRGTYKVNLYNKTLELECAGAEAPHQPLPLLEGNPIWVYKYEHIPMPRVPDLKCWVDTGDRSFTYYFLGGQKEIDGKFYRMMGEVISDKEGEITLNHWLPVREENGIVYAITDSLPGVVETEDNYDARYNDDYPMPYLKQGNECVLYNFSTDIGETLYPQNEGSTVKSIDTYQLLDGTECRVLKTQWALYDLYEKLGFLNADPDFGIMDPFIGWPVPLNGHIYLNILNAYYQDNIMLYKAPDARDGLCVNDTCWTRDDAEAYARSYKADPHQEEVFSYIRQLQKASIYNDETAEEYFPEGTKWTEIRLDTLKYDSWYSKVGDSWVPNFETIEYHVEGDYTEKWGDTYKCVFSNDPEWMGTPLLIKETSSDVSVSLIYDEESKGVMWPATVYQFNWSVGKGLYYEDLLEANSTGIVPYYFFYGVIDEIKEAYFGGVRPLKYVDLDGKAPYNPQEPGNTDTRGGRIIQGIGITEWNDGECIFGPPNPNLAKTLAYGERHYRSMLVHFERDGEVLYDVWPRKGSTVEVTIDDLNYFLYLNSHEAVLTNGRNCSGEVDIPSELSYDGRKFIVTGIGDEAFSECYELTAVTIPSCVTSIGECAFAECNNLANVYCHAEEVPDTHPTAFGDIPTSYWDFRLPIDSATLHVPAGSIDKYKTTSPWSEFGNIVALSPDLTQIRIKDRPGETLEYIGKIGSDFDTALDSLRILKTISSDIEKEPLEVIFDYDNRLFFGIIYGDCAMYSDVLDTKGNYYLRTWYSSDETSDPVTFTAGQMATIILPTAPDASKGKYYRLDRVEDKQIVFEQELQPRARVPYIIVPSEDFSIDPGALDLEGLQADTVSIGGISFIGSYVRKALPQRGSGEGADSFYIDIIDTTPDCSLSPSGETGQKAVIGALRAYLSVRWDDPIDYGGTRGPQERLEVVLRDHGTSIGQPREEEMVNGKSSNGECFDLCGRKIVNGNRSNGKYPKEIYIEKGRKRVVK